MKRISPTSSLKVALIPWFCSNCLSTFDLRALKAPTFFYTLPTIRLDSFYNKVHYDTIVYALIPALEVGDRPIYGVLGFLALLEN